MFAFVTSASELLGKMDRDIYDEHGQWLRTTYE